MIPRKPHHKQLRPKKPWVRKAPKLKATGKLAPPESSRIVQIGGIVCTIHPKQKPMNRRGKSDTAKRVAAWEAELRADWQRWGYGQYCMVRYPDFCKGTLGLARAHSMKRRFAKKTRQFYREVIDACTGCHDHLDNDLSHGDMLAEVLRIREKEGIPA